MKWLKENGVSLFFIIGLLIGIGLVVYPKLSNFLNQQKQSLNISKYTEMIQDNTEQFEELWKNAKTFNQNRKSFVRQLSPEEKESYLKQLSIHDSMMGYIEIPKIDVYLPIYHGTSEDVLQQAVGHIETSSLPVGGKGTHCVLSGHRGLPSARLFSDLDKLEKGDTFTLTVLDRILTYKVDQIHVVDPNDLKDLEMVKGKDYCTLVTCTPYGINSHRMLVRGKRVKNPKEEIVVLADAVMVRNYFVAIVLGIVMLLLYIIIQFLQPKRKKI